MKLKRLWDITNKKMVFVKGPTGHECQLWVDEATGKMYYYDMAQWLEYEQSAGNDGRTYGPTWETVDGDDDMGVYDTNNPTDLFTWESGDKVSYVFKDWNGTVLKEGKVDEGTAPTAPADPTRESTAEYTYTFTGWNPTVAPITKKTTYTAQYEATPRNYTVTIGVSPEGAGTVDTQQVTVAYGTEISYTNNVLMIGSNEITATAETGYEFSSWGTLPATVTENLTITATFELNITVQSISNISSDNIIVGEGGSTTFTFDYLPANANDFSNVSFNIVLDCYQVPYATADITSFENGTATVTLTGTSYTGDSIPDNKILLNGTDVINFAIGVRPYAEVSVIPAGGGTVTLSKPFYVPYGGTVGFNGGTDTTTDNPATVEIYGNNTIVDNVTITAIPEDGYNFERFSTPLASDGYDPEASRTVIFCTFTPLS